MDVPFISIRRGKGRCGPVFDLRGTDSRQTAMRGWLPLCLRRKFCYISSHRIRSWPLTEHDLILNLWSSVACESARATVPFCTLYPRILSLPAQTGSHWQINQLRCLHYGTLKYVCSDVHNVPVQYNLPLISLAKPRISPPSLSRHQDITIP